MFVPESANDKAIEIAKQAAESVKVGAPTAEGVQMGPVVSEVQYNKIQGLIQSGIDEGATLVTGRDRAAGRVEPRLLCAPDGVCECDAGYAHCQGRDFWAGDFDSDV